MGGRKYSPKTGELEPPQQHSETLSLQNSETKSDRDLNIKTFALLNPYPKLNDVMILIPIKRIPQKPLNTCVCSNAPKCTQKSLRERSPPSWITTNRLLIINAPLGQKRQNARIPHILGTQRAANVVTKPH